YRGLLLVSVPDMLPILAPAPDDRLVNILPVRAGQHQAVLLPDKTGADLEAGILKSVMEDTGLGSCVEHIDGSVLRHRLMEAGEGIHQELQRIRVIQVIVGDLPGAALQVDHVRGIGTWSTWR